MIILVKSITTIDDNIAPIFSFDPDLYNSAQQESLGALITPLRGVGSELCGHNHTLHTHYVRAGTTFT